MKRDTARQLVRSRWVWSLVPLTLLLVIVVLLILSVAAQYQPFVLRDYRVTPRIVCSGGDVTAMVTRKFTTHFEYLNLSEQWISVEVPGLAPGLPIGVGSTGTLPTDKLKPQPEFGTVPSPLLNTAPIQPGVYRVRIIAEFQGLRFGFLPAVGDAVFRSNLVRVRRC